ncbi:CD63 antigen Granulophysin Lysosomal-associated membrane protein 3 [Larimichthys crocea]|uniref:Tetraspanin n=1 Tax=Larimichthys crocea TaxID=215358 RepID=A0A6G0HXY7_LARCR|nr:CD63 antigen Granulophysin Lysosomal-associated membrane protein 3 [Larimichthys crocea]
MKICSCKCAFVFFNVLFMASGVALIVVGVLQHTTYTQIGTFAGSALSKIAIVLIAVGVTITLVSFLGHIGACFNSSPMVTCFICVLIAIIIMEILTGAAFYFFRSKTALLKMKSAMKKKASGAVHEYSQEKRHAINRIQEKFKCCGAMSPGDWSSSVGWENHDAVPDSCCKEKSDDCGKDLKNAYESGCVEAINIFLLKNLVWVGALCITLGILEVFGVVLGVCFCMTIRRNKYQNIE